LTNRSTADSLPFGAPDDRKVKKAALAGVRYSGYRAMFRGEHGGGAIMTRFPFVVLTGTLIAAAGPAWALSGADIGSVWIQAPFNQRIQVTNILSRDLGVDPARLQQCLDQTFADPTNAGKTIREAAQQCKEQKP
jgi:hypothetical protein